MNTYWVAVLSCLFGALLLHGVERVWERRGRNKAAKVEFETYIAENPEAGLSQLDHFDIDYNYVAMRCNHYSNEYDEYCTLDSRHNSAIKDGAILHRGADHQWLQPAIDLPVKMRPSPIEIKIDLIPDDFFEKNRRAFEYEQRMALSITREARGYNMMPFQCNTLNNDPAYPYYCVRRANHVDDPDPQVRRHGYAGVFWD